MKNRHFKDLLNMVLYTPACQRGRFAKWNEAEVYAAFYEVQNVTLSFSKWRILNLPK